MSLSFKYNNEDILVRAIIAGILDVLNNKIKYNQVWGNDPISDIETISVPWFYNQSGDERFMQDFYTHYAQCLPPKPVDGNFDMIPRGIVTYTGSAIDSARMTSRFVKASYVKEINGKLEGFVAYLNSLPLKVNFDCELWADNEITALKIEQEIREAFYRNVTYYVYYKGMRLGCTAGFPDNYVVEKNIKYSFEQDNKIRLTFALEIEAYQPIFDTTTEMSAKNRIKGFGYRLYNNNNKNDGELRVVTPENNITVPKGNPLYIQWSFTKEEGIFRNVNLYWLNTTENDRTPIEIGVPNHEYYIWNIPENFTSYIEPNMIWEENNSIHVARDPIIKIIPNLETREITADSFKVLSEGYFMTSSEDSSISIQLEMTDSLGNISYSPDGAIWANVKYNKMDLTNPIWISPDVSLYYPEEVDFKNIDIHITNTVNSDVFTIINNIKVV